MKEEKRSKYKELVDELLSRFPEFRNSQDRKEVYENDGPYIYFSYFGDFLLKKIDESKESEFVKQAFSYINEIHERKNLTSDIWDLFGIELLERFEWKDKYQKVANRYLKGKALLAFQKREGRPHK